MSTSGCRTLAPTVAHQITHDSIYQAVNQYDSIYIMDHSTERYHPSAYHYDTVVQAYLKVDTIYRDRTQTEYRYRLLHDTTYVQHTDTIPKVITVTQTKYRLPPWGIYLIVIPFVLFILLLILVKKISSLFLPQL